MVRNRDNLATCSKCDKLERKMYFDILDVCHKCQAHQQHLLKEQRLEAVARVKKEEIEHLRLLKDSIPDNIKEYIKYKIKKLKNENEELRDQVEELREKAQLLLKVTL